MTPTAQQLRDHLSIEFGLSITQVIEILRTPTHPANMRDEFALAALPTIIDKWERDDHRAQACYRIADAMLAERSKNG